MPILLYNTRNKIRDALSFNDVWSNSDITFLSYLAYCLSLMFSYRLGETKSAFCTVATLKDGKLDNRSGSLDIDDLIREHSRKKEDDLSKFKEFANRQSPTLHPNLMMDQGLQYTPTGQVHLPTMNGHGSRWKMTNHHYQQHHSRQTTPSGSSRSPVIMSTPPPPTTTSASLTPSASNGVVSSMKTGHHTQPTTKHQWASSKSATPTKA